MHIFSFVHVLNMPRFPANFKQIIMIVVVRADQYRPSTSRLCFCVCSCFARGQSTGDACMSCHACSAHTALAHPTLFDSTTTVSTMSSPILAHTFCTFVPVVSGVAKWQCDVTSVAVVCSASLTKPKSCHCFARARFTLEEERFAKSRGRGTRAWVGLLQDDDRIEDEATKNIRFEHVEDAHSGTTSFSVVPLCAPLQQPCAFHSFNTQDSELQEYNSTREYTKNAALESRPFFCVHDFSHRLSKFLLQNLAILISCM